jgi:hypothetical protein
MLPTFYSQRVDLYGGLRSGHMDMDVEGGKYENTHLTNGENKKESTT